MIRANMIAGGSDIFDCTSTVYANDFNIAVGTNSMPAGYTVAEDDYIVMPIRTSGCTISNVQGAKEWVQTTGTTSAPAGWTLLAIKADGTTVSFNSNISATSYVWAVR